ncbi:DUF4248 domain-containing protein [Phocaeicola dorei]|nr:DUF4248 domain-containing protein [Phocaeicola dorei]
MENFQIRSYGKSELALCYSPDITESAARRKLMRWIDRKPGLMGAMRAAGYNELSHTFLPLEVKLIVEALGGALRMLEDPRECRGILREHREIHGNTGITTGDAKRRRRRSRRRSFFLTHAHVPYICMCACFLCYLCFFE